MILVAQDLRLDLVHLKMRPVCLSLLLSLSVCLYIAVYHIAKTENINKNASIEQIFVKKKLYEVK